MRNGPLPANQFWQSQGTKTMQNEPEDHLVCGLTFPTNGGRGERRQ